jgi:uncharacterized protein DUF2785
VITRLCSLAAAAFAAALSAGPMAAAADHDVAFWRSIAANRYAVPPGSDLGSLVDELTGMLASPDPDVRDEIAYSTFASWIYQQKLLDAAMLRRLADRLLGNLTARIGERDTDSVFRRSFSALSLSVIVARDNADPVLDADMWHRIESAAIAYLAAEQDLRGYDERNGWMHSAAHTADLLKFLGRSRYLDAAGQRRILDAVAAKLAAASIVFGFGEDERFARAILALTARTDFDDRAFAAWLARTKPHVSERPTVAELRAIQNWKNVLAKLEVLLSNEAQPSDTAAAARTALRGALKTVY